MTSFQEMTFSELLSDAEVFVDGDWVESKDQDPNGDVRLIQLADIGDGFYIDKSSRFLNSETAKRLKCTYLKEGDILVARMPDPLGRACIFPQSEMPCVTVVDVCIIRPNQNKVDNRWLMHTINSPVMRQRINEYVTGTTRQRISRGNFSKLKVSVPPLLEQRRIASILDKVDELRQKRQQAIEKLDQLLQATFIEMFGDPILNTKNWPSDKKLGDIADIVSGITKGRKITGKSLREIPYLAVSNVQDKYLNLSVIKTIEASDEEIERYKLQQGDLLLTEGGDPDKLGRGTLWNNDLNRLLISLYDSASCFLIW
jgi:type I restriction enzyme, S subunit